ncbi:MAG TPA: phosphatidylcholine/phosphatidylserine synthase [Polyangia bacterium]|jgi:CDP-diacylglycerol--serine O-phosphatidyltransferase|nr:phosphatidylcholine/phosphatidylserine synthase [Polyangia bacterium]
MNLRKTFLILPNLFTLASLFCGFFAIATVSSGSASMALLYQAAIAISYGFFFDMSDGRVARLTKTQSSLGLQLDSLSDLVTFGVAPALVMYRWGLDRLTSRIPYVGRHLGLLVVFCFVATAALRLARFNVLALQEVDDKKTTPGKYILGLPVPVAAGVLVCLVGLNYQLGGSLIEVGQAALAVVVLVLSYLMVSRVRFRSFKDLRLSRRTVTVASAIVASGLIAIFYKKVPSAFVFMLLTSTYVGLGLMEEVLFFRRRRAEEAAARAKTTPLIPADGGATSDEDVLAELGAFEGEEEQRGTGASAKVESIEPRLASRRN